MGPASSDEMTEQEEFMKKTFLAPLADKDKAAWKLGSLNEDNVQGVMKAVVKGVGCELTRSANGTLLRWTVGCESKWQLPLLMLI